MASAFGHAFTAIAIRSGYSKTINDWKFLILGIICSILPDADVLSFKFGIAYEAFWGHRGFTHSIVFAFLLGLVVTTIFYSKAISSKKGLFYILFFSARGLFATNFRNDFFRYVARNFGIRIELH